jgi:hypothetical protein
MSAGNRRLCDGFELTEGDVADIETLVPILDGVEPVMHLAASAHVGESVTDPRKCFRNNVESVLGHMAAVLASEVRISYSPLPATPAVSQRCFRYRKSSRGADCTALDIFQSAIVCFPPQKRRLNNG